MNRMLLVLLVLFSLPAHSQNEPSRVRKTGDNVYISSGTDGNHEISYWFKRCMANDLFTFYRVSIASAPALAITVNEANSDNIGPFDIQDGGWCGGNHLFTDNRTKTAETFSIKMFADEKSISSDTTLKAHTVRLEVKNRIFSPLSATFKENKIHFTDTLCIENVIYTITGNNIQADVSHDYINKIPATIARYYGMQSVFINEQQLLTPSGKYASWTDITKTGRFKKKDFPLFNRFIEKSDYCFQASYLLNRGLGSHSELSGDDVIFIGNSWTKCYHKLMGNILRGANQTDSWSGVYTWITAPLVNTGTVFAYEGVIDGKRVIFFSMNTEGSTTIPLPESLQNKKINVIENTSGTKVKKSSGHLHLSCPSQGSVILSFDE